jgi:hypothetical protein
MIFLLFITVILGTINGVTAFDTQAFALAHPCVWSVCNGLPSQEQNYTLSCCTLQVPLNYAQPNQSSISIFMLRLSPPNPNNNTLFVLSGGPGESGISLVLNPERMSIENGNCSSVCSLSDWSTNNQ